MNPIGKKFISVFLVFSLFEINCATLNKIEGKRVRKKHGAHIVIQKINRQQVSGELITIKQDTLSLLNTEGKDASINIADIRVIRILKKPKVHQGTAVGALGITGIIGIISIVAGKINQDELDSVSLIVLTS
jgi:hypothetical protein